MPPDHLAVYLSNRCNLNCRYCYVAVNQGEPAKLTFEHIRANLDYFFDNVPGGDKKVTFLGGEPFLNFGLLQKSVDHVRERCGDGVVLQTFTNGTNISQDKLDWLDSRRVFVTVSLDGEKSTNDRNRVYLKSGGRSVYDDVMARLKDVRRESLGISLVFDSGSVGDLLKNVELFRRMGFSRITFNPELYEFWPEEKLALLEKVMQGFRRYYKAVLDGPRPFTVPILFSVLETEHAGSSWWHDCHNVVLGSDNRFYSCDKALTFPYEKISQEHVGDAAAGMDWDQRGKELGEARAVVDRVVGGRRQYFCPMGVVFFSRFNGTPPERMLENFTRVAEIFGGALQSLVEQSRPHPAFRALYEDVQRV